MEIFDKSMTLAFLTKLYIIFFGRELNLNQF